MHEKIRAFIATYHFPIQILFFLIPHMDITGNIKYLPIIGWNALFLILHPRLFSPTLKDNSSIFFLIASMIASSVLNFSPVDIAKTFLLSLNAFMILNTKIENEKNLKIVIGFVLLTCLIPVFEDGYLKSIYSNQHTFAISLAFGIYLASILTTTKLNKALLISLFLIPLFYTKSRGSALFVLIYFGFLFLFQLKLALNIKKNIIFGLTLSIFSSYFFLLHNSEQFEQNLNNSIKIHRKKPIFSLSGREVLYNKSVEVIRENPLGIGSQKSQAIFNETLKVRTPHNLLLKLGVDYGVLSLGLYLFLFFYLFMNINNPYFLSFFFAYNIKLLFESGLPFGFSLVSVLIIYPPLFHLYPKCFKKSPTSQSQS